MSTDHYAVAGFPVEHSRSPFIHAQFARATGQSIDYGRLPCPPGTFDDRVRAFAADGARGCNVTVPYKFDAYRLAAQRSPRAELAQAVNTLRFDASGWFGDNTDGIGLVRDIEQNAGVRLLGLRVLLIGAGGAAAGALGALIDTGIEEIVIANRTLANAQTLADRHIAVARQDGVELHARPLDNPGRAFDIVINATSSSLQGAGIPVAADVLKRDTLAVDMMYGAAAQPFIEWATQHGATPRDGLGMLVEQAAEAFFVWRNVRPPTADVLVALRAQLEQESP